MQNVITFNRIIVGFYTPLMNDTLILDGEKSVYLGHSYLPWDHAIQFIVVESEAI